jgi:DNA (cytosine-5)-methyltransferase 1
MKVLNLYAGIGGNRKLWEDVEVTAVEFNPKIAAVYQEFFPKDKVVIGDAHEYLLNNYHGYDFIWSSPPCPTHSKIRNIAGVGRGQNEPVYPDMKLYQEVIFLKQIYNSSGCDFNGKYCVENVAPYYDPLIHAQEIANHYFWCNFHIHAFNVNTKRCGDDYKDLAKDKGYSDNEIEIASSIDLRKDTLFRNCVNPYLGLHILNSSKDNAHKDLFN